MTTEFTIEMQVRDYECDLQGIVNNAQYLHYAEHTRNAYLRACGLSLDELHAQGIDAVVASVSLQYKQSLRPGDTWVCHLSVEKKGVRYLFHQEIYRKAEQVLCTIIDTVVVCVRQGRVADCPEVTACLTQEQ